MKYRSSYIKKAAALMLAAFAVLSAGCKKAGSGAAPAAVTVPAQGSAALSSGADDAGIPLPCTAPDPAPDGTPSSSAEPYEDPAEVSHPDETAAPDDAPPEAVPAPPEDAAATQTPPPHGQEIVTIPAGGYLTAVQDGRSYTPYENFWYASTYLPESDGMLSADGSSFLLLLPTVCDQFPRLDMEESFELRVIPGARITHINVYSAEAEPLAYGLSLEELRGFIAGYEGDILYVEAGASFRGTYRPSIDRYESKAFQYGFALARG